MVNTLHTSYFLNIPQSRMYIPPPRFSLVASVRSGIRRTRAEMSVHNPTATSSDDVAPSPNGLMSKHAISTSRVVFLQEK